MNDPCPYQCANPDCSYRRNLHEREDQVAALERDLNRYKMMHRVAEDQLNDYIVRTREAERSERRLREALTAALDQLVNEWPMRARKTIRDALGLPNGKKI